MYANAVWLQRDQRAICRVQFNVNIINSRIEKLKLTELKLNLKLAMCLVQLNINIFPKVGLNNLGKKMVNKMKWSNLAEKYEEEKTAAPLVQCQYQPQWQKVGSWTILEGSQIVKVNNNANIINITNCLSFNRSEINMLNRHPLL